MTFLTLSLNELGHPGTPLLLAEQSAEHTPAIGNLRCPPTAFKQIYILAFTALAQRPVRGFRWG